MDDIVTPEIDLDRFFEMTADILVIAAADGYYKKVSPSFIRTLGYSERDVLTTPILDFVHPEDLEETTAEFNKLRRGEPIVQVENRVRHKDGSYRRFSWSARPDPNSELIYCVARDVTELQHTKQRLQQIVSVLDSEMIFAVTDRRGRITEANDKFCEVSGYSRDELIGSTHAIVNSGQHPPGFFKSMWQTISAGRIWSGLIQNRRKDGSTYFVQSMITPLYDDQGEISNYLAIRFDTTRHVKVREELGKTLKVLNLTGAIAKVGGWEMDVATGELTWTDETFRILEVEKQEDSKPMLPEGLELFVEEHKPIIEAAVEACATKGIPYSLELKARTAKGNVLWVYTNGQAEYVDGEIKAIYGTIQDIQKQRETQEAYERERMKSIHSSKLASLGEMAAGVAHEINNPLAIISGSAQLIPRFIENPEKVLARVEEIERSSRRIERIVNNLRRFSRSDSEHNFEQHDLNNLVKEACVLLAARFKRLMIPVRIESEVSDAWIRCDDVAIEQVIINLVNNAIDAASESDEPRVTLGVRRRKNRIELIVEDNGPGIPADVRERVFEPFFTTKRPDAGTGLGLSITQGIIEDHGASITLAECRDGTRFIVTFPQLVDESHAI